LLLITIAPGDISDEGPEMTESGVITLHEDNAVYLTRVRRILSAE
jgi:hypothetical protein